MKIRLLLVDDHAVVRTGLRMMPEGESDIDIAGEAENASEALNQISQLNPDVILMDIGLPDMSGIDATRKIKEIAPNIQAPNFTSLPLPAKSFTIGYATNPAVIPIPRL